MAEWYCFKCKVPVEERDVEMTYLEIVRFIAGLKCPQCGAAYLTEETVEETVRPGEEQLEEKLG